jgi:DNA polymerase III subunit epsilon
MQNYGLSDDGRTITLQLFEGELPTQESPKGEILHALYVDLETTGLDASKHQIIEIGLLLFSFNPATGKIYEFLEEYSSFQDPGVPIPTEITTITGITTEMVEGMAMDHGKVDALISHSDLLISHNARFDRAFLDPVFSASQDFIWGCSMSQIPWRALGCGCQGLGHLCRDHGFFFKPHRALNDVKAAVHLLTFESEMDGRPYLATLYENSQSPSILVRATGSPYESRIPLKENRFRWDASRRVWEKTIDPADLDEMRTWLQEKVYPARMLAEFIEISPKERFAPAKQ